MTTVLQLPADPPVGEGGTVVNQKYLAAIRGNYSPLINGDVSVCQLGTSISAIVDNAYASDGCRVLLETSTGCNWAQNTTSGNLDADAKYGDQLSVVTTNKKFGMFRPMEGKDIWDMRGDVGIFAATVYADASLGTVKMAIVQWTGTEDAISADIISAWGASGTDPTLIASWSYVVTPIVIAANTTPTRFAVAGTISSSATNIGVLVWNDDNASTTASDKLVVSNWDFRRGAVLLPFYELTYQENLARCQRYAPVFDAALLSTEPVGVGFIKNATSNSRVAVKFPQRTRVSVTGATVSNATNFILENLAAATAVTALAFSTGGQDGAILDVTTGALTAGQGCLLRGGNANCKIEFTGARL